MSARRVAVVALCATLCGGGVARAADYGYFIDVETEDQLLDLLSSGEIDSAVYDALIDVFNDGVDLNTANREELYSLPNLTYEECDKLLQYREAAGEITDLTALVQAGVLSDRKLLALAPFLIPPDAQKRVDAHGKLRYRAAYVVGDTQPPPMLLSTRVNTLKHKLDLGVTLALTRTELGDPVWDPNRNGLAAAAPSVTVRVPKFHIQYKDKNWHVIGGTFRIGFGQRLTLDNTSQYNPNGLRIDDQIYYNRDVARECKDSAGELSNFQCAGSANGLDEYQAPDYKWPVRFRGVALGYKSPELQKGWLQVYGFGSFQTKGVYQYDIFDAARCTDPNDDLNPDCKAPFVYKLLQSPLAPTTTYSFSTLPNMYNELTAGGNFTYFIHRRAHVGLTGYGANVYWLADGARLSFQEQSATPFGGAFGTVGMDAAWGYKWLDLAAEVSRSFDREPKGGGWAAIARATATFKKQELELSGRYFDPAFNNPYARPISAADEFNGVKAADETGFRVRYIGGYKDLELRAMLDVWWDVRQFVPKVRFKLRGEYEVTRWFRPALWLDVQDKNTEISHHGECFSTPFDTIDGEPIPCNGMKARFGVQLKFLPKRYLTISLRYLHTLVDDPKYPTEFRQDLNAWFQVSYEPLDWLTLRLRVRYLNEDIPDRASQEESIWAYLESIFDIRKSARIKLRYEVYAWLDQRASTATRSPNPAHWLRLEVEYRF